MKLLRSVIFNTMPRRGALLPLLGVLIFALAATACEPIFDNPEDCSGGLRLRFVYDYHMMYGANAFPEYVDCVTVYVFDKEGNYVAQQTETSDELRRENYRMTLNLEPGEYDIVAYGGIACAASKFNFTPNWNEEEVRATQNRTSMSVELPRSQFDNASGDNLHDIENRKGGLFYAAMPIKMPDAKSGYAEETVKMMNDTNNIQVILQELNDPYRVNYDDFEYKIIDDNFILDHNNEPVSIYSSNDFSNPPHYKPYAGGNRQAGYVDYDDLAHNGDRLNPDSLKLVQVACAELSTSRLSMKNANTAMLIVTKKSTGEVVIRVPLITYLLFTRGWGDSWIKSDQEYLDRQHRWTLMFFLQNGMWMRTVIAINNWVVRLNNIDF